MIAYSGSEGKIENMILPGTHIPGYLALILHFKWAVVFARLPLADSVSYEWNIQMAQVYFLLL